MQYIILNPTGIGFNNEVLGRNPRGAWDCWTTIESEMLIFDTREKAAAYASCTHLVKAADLLIIANYNPKF